MIDVLERTYFAGPLSIFKLECGMGGNLRSRWTLAVQRDLFDAGSERPIEAQPKSKRRVGA